MTTFAGLELACIGAATGAFLIQKGLWYQGKLRGRITRAA